MKLFSKKSIVVPRDKKGSVTVIIAAAGSGTRLGGVPKPLMTLGGKTVIEHSLDVFTGNENVTRIVISAKESEIEKYRSIVSGKYCGYDIEVVAGGDTRQESVAKAFEAGFSKKITDFVAIHDAARPLLTQNELCKVLSEAIKYGCAVCAAACPDTVKRGSKSGFVSESVEREGLYLIQTPQVFSYEIYSTALALAKKDGYDATDDSSLVQAAGFNVKLTDTSRNNIKVTYPGDLELAEMIIASRKGGIIQ